MLWKLSDNRKLLWQSQPTHWSHHKMTGLTDALALREISVLHCNCTSSCSFQTPKLKETLQGDLLSATCMQTCKEKKPQLDSGRWRQIARHPTKSPTRLQPQSRVNIIHVHINLKRIPFQTSATFSKKLLGGKLWRMQVSLSPWQQAQWH